MTETLTPPAISPAAGSPLALLFDIVATTARLTTDEERDGAETAAADHVYTAYPDTLGQAVDHDTWTGYPALRDNGFEPSAVANMSGGLWLHHTVTDDADYRDVLTLLVPCACERGYVGWQLEDENDLLEILTELRRNDGHTVHDGDSGGPHCASTPLPSRGRADA
ncbi:hypothetical protein [Streptomyces sp. ITFR-6]|uniref:hypothetical protein n=1 Tax=Streptomyces sp. ITFR-6 TaxID=3075197 RepID=UPI00288BA8A9|nr:hypothetical protein [Streptomyces sp. ITFR-6]WNI34393.1 hypothetical protein RLT59_37885 [Streptomyces sp. ITFR-6]